MIDFLQDLHVHSSEYSLDASSTLHENIQRARKLGLNTLGLADHVRSNTRWIAHKREQLSAIKDLGDMEILFGVEAKILDASGALDIPNYLVGVDYILIADHSFPTTDGPLTPQEVRLLMANGELSVDDVIEGIILASINAVLGSAKLSHPPILAHAFSLLPKLGLREEMISEKQLERLGEALITRGALVEINEKWGCPSRYVTSYLSNNGVELVAGSDAHSAELLGIYSPEMVLAGEALAATSAR